MIKPLAIDLFCGLGGWSEGLIAEGWDVVGFDIEQHNYGTGVYPGQLVIQDVLTLHGSQFKTASLIVASPPCQEYSYMAMPWSLAKEKARKYESGELDVADLNRLFDACFRIQSEAEEAAGRHIPMVVENVRGAQRWVGRAKWNFGSYYLWGDVPALMPPVITRKLAEKGIPHQQKLHWTNPAEHEGRKEGGDWWNKECRKTGMARFGSKSSSRKSASAKIAKIPYALAQHIAQTFKPLYFSYLNAQHLLD